MISLELLYLSRADVEDLKIPMALIIDAVEKAFRERGEGRTEVPPKPGIHTQPDSFIHAMPAYLPAIRGAGIKWVSGYPENYRRGLPYITGLLILNDPESGLPLSVMDCTWITAKRTGAATAVAAKYLARKESKNVGIFGCGVQARSNTEALACVFPNLSYIQAFDIKKEVATSFAQETSRTYSLEVNAADDPRRVVAKSDIVVTATPLRKKPSPVIRSEWLQEGLFGCSLDFDSFWTPESMRSMNKIVTDDKRQLDFFREEGYFSETPEPYADLGEIVAGFKKGRETQGERTLAINLGLAIEDIATAIVVYENAKKRGAGKYLPL